mgnify:CR=1 FL=1
MIVLKKHAKIAILYFLIAAMLGLVLRLFPISNIKAEYRFLVHTHSHIALLGWVYLALTTLIVKISIPRSKYKKYAVIFWCTQLTIIGMLISFPFLGYALFSIIFSTLFILCSYWFYVFFKQNHQLIKSKYSYKFINSSLLFMMLSSIGPWALGIIMNTLGSTSHWYKNAIYFYLHFQYNGWFIFCLIGIFMFILEKQSLKISKKSLSIFYKLMLLSSILTLFLSFLWVKPTAIVYFVAGTGAIIQLIAVIIFTLNFKIFQKEFRAIFGKINYKILQFVYLLVIIKVAMQALSAIPYFSEITYQFLDFVIGYLHLVFLGIITLCIFVFFNILKLLQLPKIWLFIYLLGFVLTEALIFYKGISIWLRLDYSEHYVLYLVIVSSLLPIGIFGISAKNFFTSASTQLKSL